RLKVGHDLRVVLLAEPGVVVLAEVTVDRVDLGDLPGDGRGGSHGQTSGVGSHGIVRTAYHGALRFAGAAGRHGLHRGARRPRTRRRASRCPPGASIRASLGRTSTFGGSG